MSNARTRGRAYAGQEDDACGSGYMVALAKKHSITPDLTHTSPRARTNRTHSARARMCLQ